MYVYIQSEIKGKNGATNNLWTVGHYEPGPEGKFIPESDHANRGDAAARVSYLNGGKPA